MEPGKRRRDDRPVERADPALVEDDLEADRPGDEDAREDRARDQEAAQISALHAAIVGGAGSRRRLRVSYRPSPHARSVVARK
jgi:hypothetical protein